MSLANKNENREMRKRKKEESYFSIILLLFYRFLNQFEEQLLPKFYVASHLNPFNLNLRIKQSHLISFEEFKRLETSK